MKTPAPTNTTFPAACPVVPTVGAVTLGTARGSLFRLIAKLARIAWGVCR
jgi:hypothetical protein